MLTIKYLEPSFNSFDISTLASLIEVGTPIQGIKSFIWDTLNDGNITPDTIEIKDINSNTVLGTGLANTGSTSLDIGTVDTSVPFLQSYSIEAENTNSDKFDRNMNIEGIYPWYYFLASSGSAPAGQNRPTQSFMQTNVNALIDDGTIIPLLQKSNGSISTNFGSSSDDYIAFMIPETGGILKNRWYVSELNQGSIGGAESPSGNLFPDPFDLVVSTPKWSNVVYKCYISNVQTAVGLMEFRNS